MEEVEVTAHFDLDGGITPKRLIRKGKEFILDGSGRQWDDDLGLHFLVMIPGDQVFELLYDPD